MQFYPIGRSLLGRIVTGITGDGLMLSFEREVCFIVIDKIVQGRFKAEHIVAVATAFLFQSACMRNLRRLAFGCMALLAGIKQERVVDRVCALPTL